VTVASARRRRAETGFPTMSERPRTTAERPERERVGEVEVIDVVVEVDSSGVDASVGTVESKCRTPAGVHGVKRGTAEREERFPMLRAWNLKEGKREVVITDESPGKRRGTLLTRRRLSPLLLLA